MILSDLPLFIILLAFLPVSLAALRPLVIWHGLGDTYSSPGIRQFEGEIKDIYPGIFIHSVYIDENPDRDRRAGFYGNVNEQVDFVADQIRSVPELQRGFDAIGFSQGGQFLRAYVERFNDPPVHNLITFGSQHMGISDIPGCRKYDVVCQLARNAAKSAVYGDWAQKNIVQAQYFRDPSHYSTYLEANKFLTSINNEVAPEHRNQSYARRLASLNQLVLVGFSEDKTVVPKESAFFGSEPIQELPGVVLQDGDAGYTAPDRAIIPMRLQRLYLEDWIGLRRLDIRRAIKFEVCEGEHMQIGDCWEDIVRKYVGGVVMYRLPLMMLGECSSSTRHKARVTASALAPDERSPNMDASAKGCPVDLKFVNYTLDWASLLPSSSQLGPKSRNPPRFERNLFLIAMTTKVHVGNLSFLTTDERLRLAFSDYGIVLDCLIMRDRQTNSSRGFAFVTFGRLNEAEAAIQGLNQTTIDGRRVRVSLAKTSTRPPDAPEAAAGTGGDVADEADE